jgi:large subunit ribosomal protein L10
MAKGPAQKAAAVEEVKSASGATTTAVVTEYRGLTVAEIQSLRRELKGAKAEYKVQKNTLVRRAITGTANEGLIEFLEGPTAIAWVNGDISAVAKILVDFSKATPTLVVKGGVLDGKALSAKDLTALASLPSREVLLAQLAGLMAAPLRQMAGLIKAVPQNFAYGLSALIDAQGGAPVPAEPTAEAVAEPAAEEPAVADEPAEPAEVAAEESSPEPTAEAPASEPTDEAAPAGDTSE